MTYMPGPSARPGQAMGRKKKMDPRLFQKVDEKRAREEALRYKGYCPPKRQRLVIHGGMKFSAGIGGFVAFIGFIYLAIYDAQTKPLSVTKFNEAVEAWPGNAGRFAAMGPFKLTIDQTVTLPRLGGDPDEVMVDTDSTNFGVEDYEDSKEEAAGVAFATTESPFNKTLVTLPLRSSLNKTVTLTKMDGTLVFSQWILFNGYHSYGTTYQSGCTRNGGTYAGSQCFFYFTPKPGPAAMCIAVDLDAPPGQQYAGGCALLDPMIGYSRTLQNDDEYGNQVIAGVENRNGPVGMSYSAAFKAGVTWNQDFRIMVRAKQDPYVAAAIYTLGFMAFPRKVSTYYELAVPDILAGFLLAAPFMLTYGWAAFLAYQDAEDNDVDPDFDPRKMEEAANADAESEKRRREEAEKGIKSLEQAMGAPPPSTNPKILKMKAEAKEREREAKRLKRLRKQGLMSPGAIVPVDSNGNPVMSGTTTGTTTLGSPLPSSSVRKVYTKAGKKKGGAGNDGTVVTAGSSSSSSAFYGGSGDGDGEGESPTSPLTPKDEVVTTDRRIGHAPPILVSPMPSRKLSLEGTGGALPMTPLSLVGTPMHDAPPSSAAAPAGAPPSGKFGGLFSMFSPSSKQKKRNSVSWGATTTGAGGGNGSNKIAPLTIVSTTSAGIAEAALAGDPSASTPGSASMGSHQLQMHQIMISPSSASASAEDGDPVKPGSSGGAGAADGAEALAIVPHDGGNAETAIVSVGAAGSADSAMVPYDGSQQQQQLATMSQPYYGPDGGYAGYGYDDDDDDNYSTDSEEAAERERARELAEAIARAKEVKFEDLPWKERFDVFFKFHLEALLRLYERGFFRCKWPCIENLRFIPANEDDDEDDDEETRQKRAEDAAKRIRGEATDDDKKKAEKERMHAAASAAAGVDAAKKTGANPYVDDDPFKPIPAKLKRRAELLKKKEGEEERPPTPPPEEGSGKYREAAKSKYFIPVYETGPTSNNKKKPGGKR